MSGYRLLLVDDDPIFGKIFKREAKQNNISVVVCISLHNPELLSGQTFDAVVVDYDLGGMTGPELGKYLVSTLGKIPILLISGKNREVVDPEGNIRGFMLKERGYKEILDATLKLLTPSATTTS